ncbi:MAG: hypothetical protein IKO36_03645 [Bacteroidaceae bacterium]|nr:hypothetical protein [Bacteroidaceae bacterium]
MSVIVCIGILACLMFVIISIKSSNEDEPTASCVLHIAMRVDESTNAAGETMYKYRVRIFDINDHLLKSVETDTCYNTAKEAADAAKKFTGEYIANEFGYTEFV